MSVNDLLTQEEIDALLSGQSSDDLIFSDQELSGEHPVMDSDIEDWGNQQQIPALGVLNRRYAQLFKMVFFNMLRKNTHVSVCAVNALNFSEYLGSLYVPSSLNVVKINPLQGSAFFVLNPDLVFSIVENYFGGDGKYRNTRKKTDFTPMESRVIELLLEKIFTVLTKAWEPVMPLDFELVSSQVNSQFPGLEKPEENVVVSSFCIAIENDDGLTQKGELQISMPYSLLEDILGSDV